MLRQIQNRGFLAVSCLCALLVITGCFQSAGESLQATSVAQGFATFTPMPSPTFTEAPTETPFPEDIDATEDIFAPEETDSVGVIPAFETATPDLVAQAATEAIQQDANVQEQIEPPEMTATALIERATQQAALEMTQTAEAIATPIVPTLPPPVFETATPPVFATAPPTGGTCIHVVSAGENLFRISLRYGTTVHVLQDINGIANIHVISIGQQLTIPNCTGGGFPPVPPPPPGSGRLHVVRQGENLFRISLQYGVPLASIIAANPQITNPNLIYIDQQIAIP